MAKTICSKNAGVDKITFDIIFDNRAAYDRVRRSGVLSQAAICKLFGIPESRISARGLTSNLAPQWQPHAQPAREAGQRREAALRKPSSSS